MSRDLHGILPPITTPFDSDGEILFDHFRDNVRAWVESGVSGIVVAGSNGESPYLTDDEKIELLREARPLVPASKTLVLGVAKESTRAAVALARRAADPGPDFLLIGTPGYFKPRMTEDVLYGHFTSIADASTIPILLYNVPQFTGVDLPLRVIERLAGHENIAGIKESSGNLPLQAEIRRRTPDRFRLVVGSAVTLFPSLVQGAVGGVVAIACALPAMTVELYDKFCSGAWTEAAA